MLIEENPPKGPFAFCLGSELGGNCAHSVENWDRLLGSRKQQSIVVYSLMASLKAGEGEAVNISTPSMCEQNRDSGHNPCTINGRFLGNGKAPLGIMRPAK